MPPDGSADLSRFTSSFPKRFSDAIADAQGAIAGIASSSGDGGGSGLIDAESMQRLHEIYRLRVELEIETAGILWRTAEVVCALTDTLDVLKRQRLAAADVEGRRREARLDSAPAPGRAEWTRFAGERGGGDGSAAPAWPPAAGERTERPEQLPRRSFGAEAA